MYPQQRKDNVSTYNQNTGEVSNIIVAPRHWSVSKRETSTSRESVRNAIVERSMNDVRIANTLTPKTTLVHKSATIAFDTFSSLSDLIKRTGWKLEETYIQIDNGKRHVYIIMSKMFPDAKAKTGERRMYNFVDVSENGEITSNGEYGDQSLQDCKARINALNVIKKDATTSDIEAMNIRNRSNPLVVMHGQPAHVAKPKVLREWFVQRVRDGMLWDAKNKKFANLADIDLATHYATKQNAYDVACRLERETGENYRFVHLSKLTATELPSISEIIPTFVESPIVINDPTEASIMPIAPATIHQEYTVDIPESPIVEVDKFGNVLVESEFAA